VALVEKIQAGSPKARICYISIVPNLKRWSEVEQVKQVNELASAYCRQHGLDFINVFPLMLGPDGEPKPDIFVTDGLHMNAKGYVIWKSAVLPYLKP
jgi:lysophospholipase L1-like esterase